MLCIAGSWLPSLPFGVSFDHSRCDSSLEGISHQFEPVLGVRPSEYALGFADSKQQRMVLHLVVLKERSRCEQDRECIRICVVVHAFMRPFECTVREAVFAGIRGKFVGVDVLVP